MGASGEMQRWRWGPGEREGWKPAGAPRMWVVKELARGSCVDGEELEEAEVGHGGGHKGKRNKSVEVKRTERLKKRVRVKSDATRGHQEDAEINVGFSPEKTPWSSQQSL